MLADVRGIIAEQLGTDLDKVGGRVEALRLQQLQPPETCDSRSSLPCEGIKVRGRQHWMNVAATSLEAIGRLQSGRQTV